MKLEELIYKRLAGAEGLSRHLARYSGLPAVFSVEPPGDSQEGWQGEARYPQVVYSYDLQASGERKSAGILAVALIFQNTSQTVPEDIIPEIRNCLQDVLLKPEGGSPYCFAWAGTEPFTLEERTGMLAGSEVRFDILEYPSQETSDPDPAAAAGVFIKKLYPGSLVAGHDRMEEITEASAMEPVIFCRLLSADKAEETNTVAWMECRIAVHILCPDGEVRMKMAADIAGGMSLAGEVIMSDHSPMFIRHLQVNYQADYLREGQVLAAGRYGLLRYREKPRRLETVNVKFR